MNYYTRSNIELREKEKAVKKGITNVKGLDASEKADK